MYMHVYYIHVHVYIYNNKLKSSSIAFLDEKIPMESVELNPVRAVVQTPKKLEIVVS